MTEETPVEPENTGISRTRKIIILIFVIGFWVFFYWYQSSQAPPPPKTSPGIQQETPPANP